MLLRSLLTLLVLMLFVPQTFAGLYLSLDEYQRSAAYGQDTRFQSIGALYSGTSDSALRFGASAVLIDPYWVLATGHQVAVPGVLNTRFEFRVGNDLANMSSTYEVNEVYVHPKWLGNDTVGSLTGQVDLALFRLTTPVLAVTPAVRNRIVEDPSTARGTQVYMAGFGKSGVYNDFVQAADVKRGGTNLVNTIRSGFPVDVSEGALNLLIRNIDNPAAGDPNIDMEWVGLPGDSGSGWFYERNGLLELAAITSGGQIPELGSSFTYAIRLSLYNDWIDTTITAVPEPSSACLAGIAGCTLIVCRKVTRRWRRLVTP